MKRVLLAGLALISVFLPTSAIVSMGQVRVDRAAVSPDAPWVIENSTAQSLPFSQNWSNTGLITTDDIWTNVPGIIGYRGDDPLASVTGVDPQTITADLSGVADVNANRSDPSLFATGGVTEFDGIADPAVALKGSGTADAPNLVVNLNTTGGTNIVFAYNLRDLDGSANNSVQPVALQYRVGGTGSYTNIPAAFVPDASAPNDATLVTPVSVTLPAACENQALVQLRIITTNAAGVDEWIGIDDINVAAGGGTSLPSGTGASNPSTPNPGDAVLLTVTVTPGSNPTSSGLGVTADLTNIGGSDAQLFYDDGTNGDVTPGDKIFSFATAVAAGTSSGIKLLPFRVADAEDRETTGNIQLTVQGFSNPSGTGSASPNPTAPGNATVLTFTVVPGTGPAGTGNTVTADLTAIGGSAAQTFVDNGGNKFTFTAMVPVGTADGLKTFPVTIQDAQGRTGSGSIFLTVQANVSHTPAEHSVMGLPTPATTDPNNPHDYLVSRNQYLLSYDRDKGIPNWVAWHLDSSWIGGSGRSGNFAPDNTLPASWYHVQPADYSGTGFDKGHNCPSGDRTISDADNSPTFLMDNMIPQAPNNNQGPWANMEVELRTMLNTKELYIFMGNAGQGGTGSNGGVTMTIAGGKVVVPAYTWKVVMALPIGSGDLSRVNASTQVFAVIMPNKQGINADPWQKYIATVDQVEALTGYDFFSNVPAAVQNVIEARIDAPTNIAPQSLNAGTFTNLSVDAPNTTLNGDVTVNGALTLGGSTLNTNGHKITFGPSATVNRLSGMVNGQAVKQFNTVSSFTFPVGTAPFEYSPVTLDLTALGTVPSSLGVTPHNVTHPSSPDPQFTLKRFWTLTETGDLTGNLAFKYVDSDIPAGVPESTLALHRYETSFAVVDGAVVSTATNTASTTTPVSVFSDWTLMRPLAPATDLTVSGRVTSPRSGRGIAGAQVTFVDQQTGISRTVITDSRGYYTLDSVTSGQSFNVTVLARGLIFESRSIQVFTSLANEDFMGTRR